MAVDDELFERLVTLAVRTVKFSHSLPADPASRHIARQVLRSGTSAGANYEEARAAESRADFLHKMGIVLKELRETRYWMLVAGRADLVKPSRLEPLLNECEELCSIVAKSILTAKKNRPHRSGPS